MRKPEAWRDRAAALRLSLVGRITLLVAGWLLILGGIAGLFLPVLQGILMILSGLALVSIASTSVHRFVRQRFRGWPRGWRRFEKLRRRLARRLGGKTEG